MCIDRLKIAIPIFLILVITLTAFLPSFRNGFVNWDDNEFVTNNALILNLSLKNVKTIFSSFHMQSYAPLALLSYALEYRFFGLNPFVYHATNLTLHLLNSLLVFWLIFMLCGSSPVSFITAILFGVHPLHVESVAWITERRDLLYSFFFLGSIISYLYYRRGKIAKYYFFSITLFIFALFSKAMSITLPFVLLACDYILEREFDKESLIKKIPFFGLAIIFGVINVVGVSLPKEIAQGGVFSFFARAQMVVYGLVFYLVKVAAPLKLSPIYLFPHSNPGPIASEVLISAILISVLAGSVVFTARYTRKVIFGALLFLITILPTFQILRSSSPLLAADRYTYIPLIGIFYIIGECFLWCFIRIKHIRIIRALLLIIFIATIGALSFLTQERCKVWKDSLSLWNDCLGNYPNVAMAHNQRGNVFLDKGQYDKAYLDFKKAIENGHNYFDKYKYIYYNLNLGNVYRAMGKNEEAISIFKKMAQDYPNHADGHFNLANIYDSMGKKDEAIALYKRTIGINPNHVMAYDYLGTLYGSLGRKEEAVEMFKKAIKTNSGYVPAYQKLAHLYEASGKKEAKVALYKQAIANNLDYFDAYYGIGNLYSGEDKDREAIILFKKAVKINPESAEAYSNLGYSYCAIGRNREAVLSLKKAIGLKPGLAVAYNNLAVAYYYARQYDLAIKNCDKAIELGYEVKPKFLELIKSASLKNSS